MVTAALNPDGTIAVVIFNPNETTQGVSLILNKKSVDFAISGKAIQTILIRQ
jgi:glucosylceramidase